LGARSPHQSGLSEGPLDSLVTALFTKLIKRNVPIYFATGRGDSIHKILEASFAATFWDRLFVSYYNGVLTLPLADSSLFSEESLPGCPALDHVCKIIKNDTSLKNLAEAKPKRCQVTVKVGPRANTNTVTCWMPSRTPSAKDSFGLS